MENNSMLYSFFYDDGTCDFVKVSKELYSLILDKDLEDVFIETYEEGRGKAMCDMLYGLGISKTGVLENIKIWPNQSQEIAKEAIEKNLANITIVGNDDEFEDEDDEETILYN